MVAAQQLRAGKGHEVRRGADNSSLSHGHATSSVQREQSLEHELHVVMLLEAITESAGISNRNGTDDCSRNGADRTGGGGKKDGTNNLHLVMYELEID